MVSAIMKTSRAYDTKILGIVSNQAAFIGNNPGGRNDSNKFKKAVGLVGRVPLKVTNENGPIRLGDFLTSSAQFPGYAMKATRSGYVVGMALEEFSPTSTPVNGSPTGGAILTFIKPAYQNINNSFVLGEDDGGQLTGGTGSPQGTSTAVSSSFLINQKGSGNLLQLQKNGMDKFIIGNDGSMKVLANVTDNRPLLVVQNASTTVFSISATGDLYVKGKITVGRDTAGTALIRGGDNQTTVTFETAFPYVPKIVVTVNGVPNFFYGIIQKTQTGFTITADRPMGQNTTFDWVALAQPEQTSSQSTLNLQVLSSPYLSPSTPPIGPVLPTGPSVAGDSTTTPGSTLVPGGSGASSTPPVSDLSGGGSPVIDIPVGTEVGPSQGSLPTSGTAPEETPPTPPVTDAGSESGTP